jgi:hypothetical protein
MSLIFNKKGSKHCLSFHIFSKPIRHGQLKKIWKIFLNLQLNCWTPFSHRNSKRKQFDENMILFPPLFFLQQAVCHSGTKHVRMYSCSFSFSFSFLFLSCFFVRSFFPTLAQKPNRTGIFSPREDRYGIGT